MMSDIRFAIASILFLTYVCVFLLAVWYKYPGRRKRPQRLVQGYWEVVPCPDEYAGSGFYKVRWSLTDDEGRYFWVGHYPYGLIQGQCAEHQAQYMAERHCKRLCELLRMPYDIPGGEDMPTSKWIDQPKEQA